MHCTLSNNNRTWLTTEGSFIQASQSFTKEAKDGHAAKQEHSSLISFCSLQAAKLESIDLQNQLVRKRRWLPVATIISRVQLQ